jgi:hypothetical protein
MTGPQKQTTKRMLRQWVLRMVDATNHEKRQENAVAAYSDSSSNRTYRVEMVI